MATPEAAAALHAAEAKYNALQKEMQVHVQDLQLIEKEFSKCATTLAKFESQHAENDTVKQELDILEDDGKVFKLIGPALVPQDLDEAKDNVNKRIEYVGSEIKRYTAMRDDIEKRKEAAVKKCQDCQGKMQAVQQRAAADAQKALQDQAGTAAAAANAEAAAEGKPK